MKRALSFLLVGFVVSACGLIGGRKFQEGYFLVEGDTSKVSYPLIIIRYKEQGNKKLHGIFVDQLTGLFSKTSLSNEGEARMQTSSNFSGGVFYHGVIAPEGDTLKVQEGSTNSNSSATDKLDKVNKEYVLKKVSKQVAIDAIRNLIKFGEGSTYPKDTEAQCELAFDMNCTQVFGE